jgi:hypothetical protein
MAATHVVIGEVRRSWIFLTVDFCFDFAIWSWICQGLNWTSCELCLCDTSAKAAASSSCMPMLSGRDPTIQQGRCNGTGLPFSSCPCLPPVLVTSRLAHSLIRTTSSLLQLCSPMCVRACPCVCASLSSTHRCGAWLAHAFHIPYVFSTHSKASIKCISCSRRRGSDEFTGRSRRGVE